MFSSLKNVQTFKIFLLILTFGLLLQILWLMYKNKIQISHTYGRYVHIKQKNKINTNKTTTRIQINDISVYDRFFLKKLLTSWYVSNCTGSFEFGVSIFILAFPFTICLYLNSFEFYSIVQHHNFTIIWHEYIIHVHSPLLLFYWSTAIKIALVGANTIINTNLTSHIGPMWQYFWMKWFVQIIQNLSTSMIIKIKILQSEITMENS